MKDRQINGEDLKNLVLRLSHWDSKVRQDAYDSLLAAGEKAISCLVPNLAARDPVLRITALDLCCRLHPKGAREYVRRVWLGDKNINVAAALLENLGAYGETLADLCLATDLVSMFQHPYTSYAGSKAAKMIGRKLGRATGDDKQPAVGRPGSWEELILVVDDSRTARCFYRDILENSGPYRVEEAGDGLEGLAMSLKKKYDLLLVDINLPHLDGITLVKELRQSDRYKRAPIILVSTEVEARDVAAGLCAGASAYLAKPVSPEDLAGLAGALLREKRR